MTPRHVPFRASRVISAVVVALVALVIVPATRPAHGQSGVARYRPPTDGAVIDPFRPPPKPWLSGNRGIEYATVPGSAVRVIGPGRVTFAGTVVGRLIVTVTHPDGLRSSYVGLATIDVGLGARLAEGTAVGTAAGRLHLGVRRGTTYLDPASLWGRPVRPGRARLVPTTPRRRSLTLGAAGQRAYTRQPAHHPVDPHPSSSTSPQRSLSGFPTVLRSWTSLKPLERSGP